MNTYFNEIISKPINKTESNILYKIPAGAMCGNGDIGVVFDNDEKDLIIRISKCDFWKFENGAHGSGGIKTVGAVRIGNVDLSEYNIKQYFDKGLLDCTFGKMRMEFFVAPENIIYFEIRVPESEAIPTADVEIPDTCGSKNSVVSENGTKCYTRKFCGDTIVLDSAVSVCIREISSDISDVDLRYETTVICHLTFSLERR